MSARHGRLREEEFLLICVYIKLNALHVIRFDKEFLFLNQVL